MVRYRGDELERGQLQLADVLDEEGRHADAGRVQHRGVGEVVRGEQLGEQRDALVRVRVQLAHRARGAAATSPRHGRAAAAPLAPVHCNTRLHVLAVLYLYKRTDPFCGMRNVQY